MQHGTRVGRVGGGGSTRVLVLGIELFLVIFPFLHVVGVACRVGLLLLRVLPRVWVCLMFLCNFCVALPVASVDSLSQISGSSEGVGFSNMGYLILDVWGHCFVELETKGQVAPSN